MCTRQINHFRKISKSPKKGTHTGGYATVLTTQMFQKRLHSAVLGTKYMTLCESSPSERKKDTCLTWAQGTLDRACGLRTQSSSGADSRLLYTRPRYVKS